MRLITACIIALSLLSIQARAQLTLKTEYIGESSYWLDKGEAPRERVGNANGSAMIYHANLNIPLSSRLTADKKPIVWGIGLAGSYAKLTNSNFTEDLTIPEITNLGAALYHLRPISERWSLMASAGVGVYAPSSSISSLRARHVLGSMSAVFIRQMNPNLELGGGIAVNSTFGYPMAFPALYVNWRTQGSVKLMIALTDGLQIKAGKDLHKNFGLSLVGEMNGQTALLEKEGKDVIFTHQYMVAALQPEIKIGSNVVIPLRVGINGIRPAYFSDRTLKAMFQTKNGYYFQISAYGSAGITVKF